MRGCTCGFDGDCLMEECELLRRTPKDPRATYAELIEYEERMEHAGFRPGRADNIADATIQTEAYLRAMQIERELTEVTA